MIHPEKTMLLLFLLSTCMGVAETTASVQIGGVTFNGLERTSPFDSTAYYGIKYADAPSIQIDTFDGLERTSLFDSTIFYGINYADAPRWSNPVPVDPTTFTSPYDATVNDKPMCMQNCVTFPEFSCVQTMDEECLYLNIYTPTSATPSSNLPVLFFLHGGSFTEGSGAALLYESDRLVREGVIVVTINYRLGILGYLGSGNYGLRDQIEALKWVSDYISNFGGDPSKITAMGQSAGASSVNLLLANPDSSSLIYRVILISSPFTLRFRTPAQGQYMQSTFESKAGCTVGDATCDALDPSAVLAFQDDPDVRNYDSEPLSEFMRWGPVIDDDLVPDHPYNLYKNNLVDLKDTILGTTRDEGVGYVVTGSPTDLATLYGTVAAIEPSLLLTLWQYTVFPDTRFTLAEIATDYVFRCVGREVAQLIDSQKTVYRYEFDDKFPAPILNGVCDDYACHGNDLTYIFGSLNYVPEFPVTPIPFTADDIALSDVIVEAYARFVKGRSPTRSSFEWIRNGLFRQRWSYILREDNQYSSPYYYAESAKCIAMTGLTSYNPLYTPTGK